MQAYDLGDVLTRLSLIGDVTGEAKNIDVFENVEVAWVDRAKLVNLIPVDQIYRPVLDALEL